MHGRTWLRTHHHERPPFFDLSDREGTLFLLQDRRHTLVRHAHEFGGAPADFGAANRQMELTTLTERLGHDTIVCLGTAIAAESGGKPSQYHARRHGSNPTWGALNLLGS